MTSTPAPRPAAVVVLDVERRDTLDLHDIPLRALELRCARCDRTQAAHGGRPPDCSGFVRPGLPPGFGYVDQLRAGDTFRFRSRGGAAENRVVVDTPSVFDEETGLVQVGSCCSPTSPDAVHLVQVNTIVELVAGPRP